ncbi:MAG: hypothetical protein Q9218_000002 [Villophora microphyllina]
MGRSGSSRVPWIETPLIESSNLSKAAGCRIFLKLENLQPSGSFKIRGIGNLLRYHLDNHDTPNVIHFYCSSGGNAGLACVTAARAFNRPATIVVPLTTKVEMIAKIKTAGAHEVVQIGKNWHEADTYLRETLLAKDKAGVYVPPFDHPKIWKGNSSLVGEMGQQLREQGEEGADVIVCSVGGGGLLSGIILGLQVDSCEWGSRCKVLALETQGADALHRSLLCGEVVTLPSITSIATSLGATRVAQTAFDLAKEHPVKSAVLSDEEAAMGCWRLADDERILVEPACGVNVAVCYRGRLKQLLPDLKPETKVVIVVCGGSNLAAWRSGSCRAPKFIPPLITLEKSPRSSNRGQQNRQLRNPEDQSTTESNCVSGTCVHRNSAEQQADRNITLARLMQEKPLIDASIEGLRAEMDDFSSLRQTEAFKQLLGLRDTLQVDVVALKHELEGYGDPGPHWGERMREEIITQRAKAERWTSNIEILASWLYGMLGQDQQRMEYLQRECYGAEYEEGNGLGEL